MKRLQEELTELRAVRDNLIYESQHWRAEAGKFEHWHAKSQAEIAAIKSQLDACKILRAEACETAEKLRQEAKRLGVLYKKAQAELSAIKDRITKTRIYVNGNGYSLVRSKDGGYELKHRTWPLDLVARGIRPAGDVGGPDDETVQENIVYVVDYKDHQRAILTYDPCFGPFEPDATVRKARLVFEKGETDGR